MGLVRKTSDQCYRTHSQSCPHCSLICNIHLICSVVCSLYVNAIIAITFDMAAWNYEFIDAVCLQ